MTHSIINEYGAIVLNTKYVRSKAVLVCDWKGEVTIREVAESCCLQIVELAAYHRSTLVLNDNRHQSGEWPDMEEWLLDYWIPSLAKSGVEYFAHLLSGDYKTNQSAQGIFNQPRDGIEFMTFSSCDSAFTWLTQASLRSTSL